MALFLGTGVSLLFLYLTFRAIPFREALASLATIGWMPIAGAVVLFAAMMLVRNARFALLLPETGLTEAHLFRIAWIGAAANYIFPARLGEFSRPLLLARHGTRASVVLGVILVERLMDAAGQMALLVLTLAMVPLSPMLLSAGAAIAAVYAVLLTLLLVLLWRPEWVLPGSRLLAHVSEGLARRFEHIVHAVAEGCRAASASHKLPVAFALTAFSWILSVFIIELTLEGFAFEMRSPFTVALVVQLAMSFAIAIPAAPGYVGTMHYSAFAGLALFGFGGPRVAGFAVFAHVFLVSLVVLPGLVFMAREGVNLALLAVAAESESEVDCARDEGGA